jgi:amino-acid N-acetyltransferase
MKTIELAETNDFQEINQLLISNNLPVIELNCVNSSYFKAINEQDRIVGAIGIEIYGRYGLLRSLVVEPECRNQGIANHLVEKLNDHAKSINIDTLFLLTTTADKYFEKKEFLRIDRDEVPDEVKQSSEFKSICPVSAIVLKKQV